MRPAASSVTLTDYSGHLLAALRQNFEETPEADGPKRNVAKLDWKSCGEAGYGVFVLCFTCLFVGIRVDACTIGLNAS